MPKSLRIGDMVIVEDPPTGVAMHAEGTVIGIDGGTIQVLIEGKVFVIDVNDVSVK